MEKRKQGDNLSLGFGTIRKLWGMESGSMVFHGTELEHKDRVGKKERGSLWWVMQHLLVSSLSMVLAERESA